MLFSTKISTAVLQNSDTKIKSFVFYFLYWKNGFSWLSFYLYIYVFIYLFIYLFQYLSIYLFLFVCLFLVPQDDFCFSGYVHWLTLKMKNGGRVRWIRIVVFKFAAVQKREDAWWLIYSTSFCPFSKAVSSDHKYCAQVSICTSTKGSQFCPKFNYVDCSALTDCSKQAFLRSTDLKLWLHCFLCQLFPAFLFLNRE